LLLVLWWLVLRWLVLWWLVLRWLVMICGSKISKLHWLRFR
jgi:hypothetical protein